MNTVVERLVRAMVPKKNYDTAGLLEGGCGLLISAIFLDAFAKTSNRTGDFLGSASISA
jgi:hypothetical protein